MQSYCCRRVLCSLMSNVLKFKIGIIGGSGLDDPDILEDRREVQVDTIFGRPSDALIVGKISGVDCILLARHGRKHDISPTNVNYRANIWALKEAGCTHILVSTACGSLKEEVAPGNLVILDSLIDLTRKRALTLHDGVTVGAPTGILHLPMEPIFSEELRQILIAGVQELGITHHKSGTAVVIEGPRFSTKAESNIYRSWGASVINMTTAPEAALAKEAGLLYAPVAMATDYDCWRDVGEKVSVEMVLKTFRENATKVTQLFKHVVPKIAKHSWDQHHEELRQIIKGSTM